MIVIKVAVLCAVGVTFGYALPKFVDKHEVGIIGGDVIDISKAPYQVAFYADNAFNCGGSILSEDFILTAGYCCFGSSPQVLAGSNYYYKGGTRYEIESMILHPKYRIPQYNVCVLKTKETIKFGKNVGPIKIAEKVPEPGEMTSVTGWGDTSSAGGSSDLLRSVSIPVVNGTICEELYKIVDPSLYICAGSEKKGVCFGDGGGALTYEGKQIGFVSFGKGCDLPLYPSLFTSILHPENREFIKNITGI